MNALTDRLDSLRDSLSELVYGRERTVGFAAAGLVALTVVTGGVWWWLDARWTPPPSIFDSPVDDVLGYLAMEDFNELPLEERMRYLGQFASRFRGFQQEESAATAAFLAGVTGNTREQMRQNARVLAKDVLLEGAEGYFATPEAERGSYLDRWLAGWQRRAEEMAMGSARVMDDEARATEIKEDAREDMARERDPNDLPQLDTRVTARFLGFWSNDIEAASTPREQGQIIRFMEDLRVHLALSD
ncbi:MAG: hypothetical protein VX672_00240 [Planctomycetota bacterium]|nr:hypothetical protein [Planctomycetota bacterium]